MLHFIYALTADWPVNCKNCHASLERLCFSNEGCATTAVALYGIAEQYNVPIFGCPSAGASSLSLNSTANRYPLLIRVPFSLSDIGLAFSSLFNRHNYTHISVFRDDSNSFYSFTAKYLMNYFRSFHPKIFRDSVESVFWAPDSTEPQRTALLDAARNRSRGKTSTYNCPLPNPNDTNSNSVNVTCFITLVWLKFASLVILVIVLLTHARLVRQFMVSWLPSNIDFSYAQCHAE